MKELPLTRGLVAQVDNEDFERFSALRWCAKPAGKKFYAVRHKESNGKRYVYHLHREIMGLTHGDGIEVDHIDGDGLNNQKSNLRICTNSENQRNKAAKNRQSGRFRWVYQLRNSAKWIARTQLRSEKGYLGVFDTDIEAAVAANKCYAQDQFVRLNEIDTGEYRKVLQDKIARIAQELFDTRMELNKVERGDYKWLK